MTSHKPRRQNNHQVNTDYESDIPYYSDMQEQPAPPPRSNEELNLSVIQRHKPSITSILSLAPYAVVYIFSPTTKQWEKNGVEGTLFVCQESQGDLGEERYTVFVLNRRGLNNFDLPLTDGENVEITEEYVICKAEESFEGEAGQNGIADPLHPQNVANTQAATNNVRIYGLWIYSEPPPNSTAESRSINAQMILECATHAGQSMKLARERLEAMRQNSLHMAAAVASTQAPPLQEAQASVSMGRQISLKDLFGQQRAQDDGWSVRAHHLAPEQQQPYPQQPQYQNMTPQQMPPHPQPYPQLPPQPQSDVLGDLFRRAGLAQGNGQGY
ncbi:Dcp1-like decapping [Penicillium bovifimosum]|uniref:Dcp1-like decapping n=1 Tax=Penicillium bovifimosum TaxID=126998 RepID=A0A9W9HHP7_9EURO|nr:Dcp1-like decapping [Penicillium bovifimosum]KAJ5146025.1 Dcp1-like decapping [Penicillium bovifimosum]